MKLIPPTAAQLARWHDDGREVLLIAAGSLRLKAIIESARSNLNQRRRLIHKIIDDTKVKIESVSTWLAANARKGATLAGWFAAFSGIAFPALYAGAMAILGTLDLAPADVKATDTQVVAQHQYLGGFKADLLDGSTKVWTASPAGPGVKIQVNPQVNPKAQVKAKDDGVIPAPWFLARSSMYADAAWGVAQDVFRARMGRDGYPLERRVLGGHRHCRVCPELAGQNWSPVGSLPRIGETPCRSKCLCHFEFRLPSGLIVGSI